MKRTSLRRFVTRTLNTIAALAGFLRAKSRFQRIFRSRSNNPQPNPKITYTMSNSVQHFALVVLLALLAPLSTAHCVVLEFDPMVTTDFEDMTEGQAISTLTPPWTGSGAPSIVAAVPAGTGNSSDMAIQVPGVTVRTAVSPQQSLPSAFTGATTGDTLYFSAWILSNGGYGTLAFNVGDSTSLLANNTLGGFGLTSSATPRYFTYFIDADKDGEPELATSSVSIQANTWYEMALVVTLDATDFTNSLGYIYYRAAGDAEFTALPEFNGVQMSWWSSSFNATDFGYYRISGARYDVQFDNLSAGMVVPEPSTSILLGAAILSLGLRRRYKRNK